MTRILAVLVVWFPLLLGLLQAAPARPLYEPPEPPKLARLELRGTTWEGQDHVPNYRITFESDGTVTYGYNKKFNRGGSWTFDGANLYFEVNKKFREFKGTVDGRTIKGDSWNV